MISMPSTSGFEGPANQRGVALLMALLVFTLITVISADLVWERSLFTRRVYNNQNSEQGLQYALGAESWAIDILATDHQNSKIDHLNEDWAQILEPLLIEGGQIQGSIEDAQGRFNINNLIESDGETNELAVAQFERLLSLLELDPAWARIAADWIDPNIEPGFPSGAEDGIYTALDPPYRPGNVPLTSTSELLAMPEFDVEMYRTLQPYIAALPVGTTININTASAPILESLSDSVSSSNAESLVEQRDESPFEDVEEFKDLVAEEYIDSLDVGSGFFRVTTVIQVGTTQFTMYSLLERSLAGQSTPVLRTFGAE